MFIVIYYLHGLNESLYGAWSVSGETVGTRTVKGDGELRVLETRRRISLLDVGVATHRIYWMFGHLVCLAPCASLAIGFPEGISGGINSKPGGVEHGFRGEVWYGVSLPIVSIMCYVLW